LTLGPFFDEQAVIGRGTHGRRPLAAASSARTRTGARGASQSGSEVSNAAQPPGAQLLLTIEQAAAKLHIGRRQAFELVWRGELPVVRLGPRTIRVAYPALEEFVLARSGPYCG